MVIELAKYKNIRPTVHSMVKYNFGRKPVDLVANMAVACGCPVIVCCFYYIQEVGFAPEETKKQISNLIKFYKYTKILDLNFLGLDPKDFVSIDETVSWVS